MKKLQCKDIPDRPVLEFIAVLRGQWANWYFGNDRDVSRAMPPGIPGKLVLAKMRQMIGRGVVEGCPCGCRGDFVLTEKGAAEIGAEWPMKPAPRDLVADLAEWSRKLSGAASGALH